MSRGRRYSAACIWAGYSWCLLNLFLWTWAGEWRWAAAWMAVGGAYCWVISRPTQPRPARPRADYARIAQLERELGLAGPEDTP